MVLRPLESVAPAANRCESQLGTWMLSLAPMIWFSELWYVRFRQSAFCSEHQNFWYLVFRAERWPPKTHVPQLREPYHRCKGYSVILDDLLPRVLRLSSKRIEPCHDLFTKSVNTTMEYFRWVQIRLDSVRRIGRIGKGMVIWSWYYFDAWRIVSYGASEVGDPCNSTRIIQNSWQLEPHCCKCK